MGGGDSRGVILLHIAATFFSLKSGQSVLRGLRARCLIVKIRCLQLSAIFFSLSLLLDRCLSLRVIRTFLIIFLLESF